MPRIAFTVFGPQAGPFISFLHRSEDVTYSAAYRGTIDNTAELDDAECLAVLERLFAEGNGMGSGPGFTVGGRSMSVGDVVTIQGGGAWVCDSVGWRKLQDEEAARFPLDAETCPPRSIDQAEFAQRYHPAYPLNNGLIVYVRRSDMAPEAPAPTEVAVAGACVITGEFYAVEHVPLHGLAAWVGGRLIQVALPALSPAQREFIKSGIRPGALTPPE